MASFGIRLLEQADILVPVPLYRVRLWRRRYNQSAELARVIARHSGVGARNDILKRVRPTRPQVGLTASQRRRNVEGAFAVADAVRPDVAGKRVILVDDVITTGATVNACASALKRACAEQVDVLAFSRVVDQG
jgi:ComF family protein